MAFSFVKAKSLVRRTVHKTFGVPAFYKDSTMSVPLEISARWHSTVTQAGDLDNQGYAQLIQNIDQVVFDAIEARTLNVKRGGEVFFPDLAAGLGVSLGAPFGGSNIGPPAFILQARKTNTGPVEEIWFVTPKETP